MVLTQFLVGLVLLVLETLLDLLDDIIPGDLIGWVTLFAGQLGSLLSYGPASALGLLVVAYLAVDTAINAYTFAITSYKLIPAKAT